MKTNRKIEEIKKDKLDQLDENAINDFNLDKLFHSAILEAYIEGRKSILSDLNRVDSIVESYVGSEILSLGRKIVDYIEE